MCIRDSSKGLFSVNGTDILGHRDLSFGLILDYGHDLLRAPNNVLIEHSFQGTLQFNYGLFNRVVVGVDLPVDLMSGAPTTEVPGWGPARLDYQGFGYVAAHVKWRILKVEHGFGLAAGVQVGDGLSSAAANAGADPGFWYWPMIMAERRFGSTGQLRLAVNGGYRGHSATSTTLVLKDGTLSLIHISRRWPGRR